MRVTGIKRNPNLLIVDEPTTTTNSSKERIHNVFIVDASGSMDGMKYRYAIDGVNELLTSINKDVDTINTVTVVEFEGDNIVKKIDTTGKIPKSYKGMGTGGMTPLNQAIGETLEYIYNKRKDNYNVKDKVLVNVFTDGGENSSTGKYTDKSVLGKFIKNLENEGFTVSFIGTQTEVAYAINSLSLDATNTLVHDNTPLSVQSAFKKTVVARELYSNDVSRGLDVKKSFYTKTVKTNN